MASYGILSGLLSGLSGLPKGINDATQEEQANARLAEQKRQFDEGRQIDLSRYAPALKAAGLDLGALPSGPAPIPIAQMFIQAAQTNADRQRKAALHEQLTGALQPGMATPTPGTSFETAPSPLAPKTAAPMSAIATPEDPLAKLRRVLPILAQLDPGAATKAVVEQAMPPKPQIVPENARGYLQGTQYTPLPQAGPAVPEGFEPTRITRGGVTYGRPGENAGKTLSERVAAARAAYRVNPTPESKDALDRLEEALKVETGLAATRAGAVASTKIETEPQEFLTPEDAGKLGVPYGTRKGQAAGRTALTGTQQTKMDAQSSVLGIIDSMERDLKNVSQPTGPLGRIYQAPQNMWAVYGQGDPELAALNGRIQSTLSTVMRALGEVGTLTDQDIRRGQALFPKFVPVPDSAETIAAKMKGLRQLVQDVAGRTGTRPTQGTARPSPSPSSAPKGETLSRTDPRYQQLRQRGMTDEQIQAKYGVQIGP